MCPAIRVPAHAPFFFGVQTTASNSQAKRASLHNDVHAARAKARRNEAGNSFQPVRRQLRRDAAHGWQHALQALLASDACRCCICRNRQASQAMA